MNLEEIKELIRVFGRSKLGELKVKSGEFEVSMVRESSDVVINQPVNVATPAVSEAPAPVSVAQTPTQSATTECINADTIDSPMVGTFYASPSPDSPSFVSVGDTVKKGQTLCILEAMKIMNELEAEYDCKILEVLVQDGEPVEYDTPLFRVEKI